MARKNTVQVWGWAEGVVNPDVDHVKIRYGTNPIPVALVSPGRGKTFTVQFTFGQDSATADLFPVGEAKAIENEARKQFGRYLSTKSEENPWPWIIASLCENPENSSPLRWEYCLRCHIERSGDFEIQWVSVENVEPYRMGHGLSFYIPRSELHNSQRIPSKSFLFLGFIDGFGWLHKTSNRARIYVLDSKSRQWGKLLPQSGRILNELRKCVYIVLDQPDGHLSGEIVSGINVLASA